VTNVLIVALVFAAAVIQSFTGFGFAAIIMPLVTIVVGLSTAAPLVALAGLTVYTVMLIRYRQAINFREALRLIVASALGVPVGFWLLGNVSEVLIKQIMGIALIAYAAYALLRPTATRIPSQRWAYPAGFAAGCLGGAYNTPGPPVIVYALLQQWPRDEFRGVLQAFFFVNGVMVVTSHWLAHHMTTAILTLYAYAAPAILLGIFVGSRLDRRVDRARFRTVVTVMIMILGLFLLLGLGQN
jgi:uncharacterized membrane protein YfcA